MFDIIIIGGGPGGMQTAYSAAQAGKKVCIITNTKLGGTCLHRGCIPTKALYHSVFSEGDWEEAKKHASEIIKKLFTFAQQLITHENITLKEGTASFISDTTVSINDEEITGKYIVIATGSRPVLPAQKVSKSVKEYTSDTIFFMESLPKKLAIIGGGYIGVEFATIFSRLGVSVTLYEQLEKILPGFNTDLQLEAKRMLTKNNVTIYTNKTITTEEAQEHDALLYAIGREPFIDTLSLNKTSISYDNKGIKVSDTLETNVKNVFALGDCIAKPLRLAHVAEMEGRYVAEKICSSGNNDNNNNNNNNNNNKITNILSPDYRYIPQTVFCYTPLSQLGDTSQDLVQNRAFVKETGKGICDNDEGWIKLYATKEGIIIGASSCNVDIAPLVIAIEQKMCVTKIAEMPLFHPSKAEVIKKAAEKIALFYKNRDNFIY